MEAQESELLETLREAEERHTPGSATLASALSNLGAYYSSTGRAEKALPHLERAAEEAKAFGDEFAGSAAIYNNLGTAYFQLGRHKEALWLLEKAVAIAKRTLGPDNPDVLRMAKTLEGCRLAAGSGRRGCLLSFVLPWHK